MSRILGIDYGTRKIGTALSDEEQNFSIPYEVYPNVWPYIRDFIGNILLKNDISEIVIGLPKNLDGTDNYLTLEVKNFVEKLQQYFRLPIHFEDESFTSRAVDSSGAAPPHKTDASAAALILKSFLDRKNQPK